MDPLNEKDEPKSYDDDLMADVMAAVQGDDADESADTAAVDNEPVKADAVEKTGSDQSKDENKGADKSADDPELKAVDDAKPADHQPPPGWSPQSKADWAKIPDHVRADIAKREQEISAGFARYQHLKPFDEMARQSGTTLHDALSRYTNLEGILRQNPDAGMMQVAQNLGWTQAEAAQHFARLAQRLGFQFAGPAQPGQGNPPANQNGEDDPLQAIIAPFMAPVMQELNQLKSTLSQAQQRDQSRLVESASSIVNEFKADPKNRYYQNVEQEISRLLTTGLVQRTGDLRHDLRTAYDMACRMNPEVHDALIRERTEAAEADRKAKEQEAAERARAASRSITGSAPGQAGVSAKRRDGMSYDDDLDADVRAAMQVAGGRV